MQMGDGEEDEQVTVKISHMGLADGLRHLEKTKTSVKTKAQLEKETQNKAAKKRLRDVTNIMEPRPNVGKPTRIITKTASSQRRPSRSSYKKPSSAKQFTNGSTRGRPPDLPNLNSLIDLPPKPSRRNVHINLGESFAGQAAVDERRDSEVAAIEILSSENKEAEGSEATQSNP